MPVLRRAAHIVRCWLPGILWTGGLWAQTCLVLSPATVNADGTASLNLAMYSARGTAPAAVQWTFRYGAASISSLTVADGPALNTSLKTAICAGDTGVYNCIATGLNRRIIANGVIAKVTAVLAPGVTTTDIQITNTSAASPSGSAIRVVPFQQTIKPVSADCRPLPQSRGSDSR